MIVTCDHCGARYRLDESKIPGRGARVTCPSCRHVFVVYRRESTEEVPRSAVVQPPPKPARPTVEQEAAGLDVNTLDFRSVGITSWKVKVKIGLIYDFNDFKTFNKNIRDGRVTATDLISFDGNEWSPIGDLSALSQRFCEVYVKAQRAMEAVDEEDDELGEDEPTRIMTAPKVDESPGRRSLIGPASEEPVGPSVNVGPAAPAASAASAGFDSGNALADALADAAAEVDGGQGNEAWKSGGAAVDAPPRFVDPFEKKAQQARSAPRRPSPPPPSTDDSGGSGGLMVAALLLILVLGGGGYWFMTQNSNAEVTTTPNPPADVNTTGSQGGEQGSDANPDAIRENLLRQLEEDGEPVEDEPADDNLDEWGIPEEPELIAVVPEEFRDGNGGDDINQNGSMQVGAAGSSGSSSYASEGDAHARSSNWSAAAASYQKAVEQDPRNTRYLEKLCEFQYRSGNVSSARSACSQAKQAGVRAASKWLGHISYDQGDTAGAVGHYQSYLSSNPPDRSEIQRRIDSINGG